MKRMTIAGLLVLAATALAVGAPAAEKAGGAGFRVVPDDPWCRDVDRDHDRPTVCEVREAILPAPAGSLTIDAAPNGGVSAAGSERSDVRLRARVVAHAATETEARALAAEVKLETNPAIRAIGPAGRGHAHWWVSFDAAVPRRCDLELHSVNGPLSLSGVSGSAKLSTDNGPLTLRDAGGSVRGRTTNGPVTVTLAGRAWTGNGLDVETVNGPLTVSVPEGYSAQLDVGTVNGPVDLGFPVAVQGSLKHGVSAKLGNGGAPIRARTTNGPLSLHRP